MSFSVPAIALAFLIGAALPARAGLYRTRDARGKIVVTNRTPGRGARPLSGGTLSVATPGLAGPPRVVPGQVAAARLGPRVPEHRKAPYVATVAEASERYRLPHRLIEAVITVESGFNPRARSGKGAQGLMQLMPGTARELAVADPYEPRANIDGGARYLRRMLDLFNQDLGLALAAYNAGPGAVQAAGGMPLFAETVDYVRKVKALFHGGAASGVLKNGVNPLSVRRGPGGRLLVSNVSSSPSGLRQSRGPAGRLVLTNR